MKTSNQENSTEGTNGISVPPQTQQVNPAILEWTKNFYFQFGFEYLNITLIALVTWLLGYVNSILVENRNILYYLKDRNSKDRETLTDEQLYSIRFILHSINSKSKASRTILLLNHNGETFSDRISYIKTTSVMEVCVPHKAKVSKNLISFPQALLHTDNEDLTFDRKSHKCSCTFEVMMTSKEYNPNSLLLEVGDHGYALVKIPNIRDTYSGPVGYILMVFDEQEYEDFKKQLDCKSYHDEFCDIVRIISERRKSARNQPNKLK